MLERYIREAEDIPTNIEKNKFTIAKNAVELYYERCNSILICIWKEEYIARWKAFVIVLICQYFSCDFLIKRDVTNPIFIHVHVRITMIYARKDCFCLGFLIFFIQLPNSINSIIYFGLNVFSLSIKWNGCLTYRTTTLDPYYFISLIKLF